MALSLGVHNLKSDAATNTTTTTGVATQATGSTFLIAIAFPNGDTVTSVTDNKSNTYTLVNQTADAGDGFKAAWYKCENGNGGSGHTATLVISSTDPKVVNLIEITGGSGAITQDGSATGVLDTSSPFDASVTTTVKPVEIVFTMLVSSGTTATITWNGGFTGIDADSSGTLSGFGTAYRVTSATGAYSPAATTSIGGNAVVITAAFSDPAVAGDTLMGQICL